MGFDVQVEGVVVYSTDEDAELIHKVHFMGPTGEAGVMGTPPDGTYVNITFERRSLTDSNYLDLVERRYAEERRTTQEEASKDAVIAGRKMMEEPAGEEVAPFTSPGTDSPSGASGVEQPDTSDEVEDLDFGSTSTTSGETGGADAALGTQSTSEVSSQAPSKANDL